MGIGGIVRPGLHVEGWCLGYGSMWAPRNERMGGGLRTGCKEPNWSGGGRSNFLMQAGAHGWGVVSCSSGRLIL